jgi:hypothetical protein
VPFCGWLFLFINLGRQYEVALGEAVDFVRPYFYADPAPTYADVGMMVLFFRNSADFVGERQGGFEIRELEFSFDVVIVDDVPIFDLNRERLDLLGGERRHSSPARNAGFFG